MMLAHWQVMWSDIVALALLSLPFVCLFVAMVLYVARVVAMALRRKPCSVWWPHGLVIAAVVAFVLIRFVGWWMGRA